MVERLERDPALRDLAAERARRDLAAVVPEPDFEAAALVRFDADPAVRDFAAEAAARDFEVEAPERDFDAEAPERDLDAEAPERDFAADAPERVLRLPCERVRAALRAAAERPAAFWLRVRAALRPAVLRVPLSVWPFSSCTSPSRRSTASRSGFGACLPLDTCPGSFESSRATLLRIPLSRILP